MLARNRHDSQGCYAVHNAQENSADASLCSAQQNCCPSSSCVRTRTHDPSPGVHARTRVPERIAFASHFFQLDDTTLASLFHSRPVSCIHVERIFDQLQVALDSCSLDMKAAAASSRNSFGRSPALAQLGFSPCSRDSRCVSRGRHRTLPSRSTSTGEHGRPHRLPSDSLAHDIAISIPSNLFRKPSCCDF